METTPLMQFLKEETRSKHNNAEGHQFQGALTNGKLPLTSYCRYLTYLYALHAGLEEQLERASKLDPAINDVVKPELYQVPFLSRDLSTLNVPPPLTPPSPAVERFLALPMFAEHPVSLLGALYVVLGSKHGAKFIAHNVKESYGLNGGGNLYFDPYGAEFRPLWQNFIAGMNELALSPAQRQSVLEAACATFDLFGEMGEEIWQWQLANANSTC